MDHDTEESQTDERVYINGQPVEATPRHKPTGPPGGYSGKLYPHAALEELALEAEGLSISGVDTALKSWISHNVTDPREYLGRLFEAIKERGCISGLCSRLNLACLSEPTAHSTTVRRANGGVTTISHMRPSLDWLPQHAHFAVQRLCRGVRQPYLGRAKDVADRVESINNSYDLEQILLVRIAYIACHAQLTQRNALPALAPPK